MNVWAHPTHHAKQQWLQWDAANSPSKLPLPLRHCSHLLTDRWLGRMLDQISAPLYGERRAIKVNLVAEESRYITTPLCHQVRTHGLLYTKMSTTGYCFVCWRKIYLCLPRLLHWKEYLVTVVCRYAQTEPEWMTSCSVSKFICAATANCKQMWSVL